MAVRFRGYDFPSIWKRPDCAVGAQEAVDAAFPDVEIQMGHGCEVAVGFCEIFGLDNVRAVHCVLLSFLISGISVLSASGIGTLQSVFRICRAAD